MSFYPFLAYRPNVSAMSCLRSSCILFVRLNCLVFSFLHLLFSLVGPYLSVLSGEVHVVLSLALTTLEESDDI